MGELIFDSLEIRNYRGFRHLVIEQLGRVNLIVGKNTVGKSSLLEAIEIYVRQSETQTISDITTRRDEEFRLFGNSRGRP